MNAEMLLRDLNHSLAVLTEIEKLPQPLDEFALLRVDAHRYLAQQAISQLNAIKDARQIADAVIARAGGGA